MQINNKKVRRRRNKGGSSQTFEDKDPSLGTMNMKKAIRELALMKRGELHYLDGVLTYVNVSGTNISFNNVSMPSIGTGLNSTAAGRITLESIDMNVTIQNVATAQPAAVRIVLGQTIGEDNNVVAGNCLENISTGPIACCSPYSFKDKDVVVKHIADMHFDTDPNWGAQRTKFNRFKLPIKQTKYSTLAGEFGGGIPWFLIANTNIISSALSVTVYTRLWFYDGA
jgi:hypothetical protein